MKDKAEDFGDKAKEGLGVAKDKASELVEDVKDRLDGDDETAAADTTQSDTGYSPAAVNEASGGITEAAADADLSEVATPSVGEVPDAGLSDLPETTPAELTAIDDRTGLLGDDQDASRPT